MKFFASQVLLLPMDVTMFPPGEVLVCEMIIDTNTMNRVTKKQILSVPCPIDLKSNEEKEAQVNRVTGM